MSGAWQSSLCQAKERGELSKNRWRKHTSLTLFDRFYGLQGEARQARRIPHRQVQPLPSRRSMRGQIAQ